MMSTYPARIVSTVLILAAGILASPVAVSAKSPAIASDDQLPIVGAWLREHLPDDALVYLRIPHPLGLLAMPKGNVLDPALRSRANAEAIATIRAGISDNLLPKVPAFANPTIVEFERHLRSPVEMALLSGAAPSALLALTLDVPSRGKFEELVGQNDETRPALVGPLDERGVGQMAGVPAPTFLRFDESSGLLLVNVGPAVTAESFAALLPTLVRNDEHALRAMERDIDDSGQGFLNWINAERALPMLQLMMQPDQYASLVAFGLDKVSSAAIGLGVANGKGRLAVVADVPDENERGLLPFVSNDLTATSVGNPDALLLLSIPSPDEFVRLEAKALELADDVKRARWAELKTGLAVEFGLAVEDVFRAVGPELFIVFDSAGDYSAIRLRDERAWKGIVERIVEATGATYEERRIGRKTYHHLAVGAGPEQMVAAVDEGGTGNWLAELLLRSKEHAYWVRDGDYLYFSSMPQVLIDRTALRARTDIGDWLENEQRIAVDEAVFSFSSTSDKIPARLYAMYLEILQLLADLGQAEFDAWSMPTAAQLGLPREGTVGLTIRLGNPRIAAELTFENNPAEALGSLGGVAVAGILAGIAVPAYQDYTIRAKVAEGLNLAGASRAAVSEYYIDRGEFPGAGEAEHMSLPYDAGVHTDAVIVEADTGVIVIRFREEAIPGGGQVRLQPTVGEQGSVSWSCTSTLDDKHLPARCRGGGQ